MQCVYVCPIKLRLNQKEEEYKYEGIHVLWKNSLQLVVEALHTRHDKTDH